MVPKVFEPLKSDCSFSLNIKGKGKVYQYLVAVWGCGGYRLTVSWAKSRKGGVHHSPFAVLSTSKFKILKYLFTAGLDGEKFSVAEWMNPDLTAGSDVVIGHNPGINEVEPINPASDCAFQGKTAPPAHEYFKIRTINWSKLDK